MEVSKNPWMSFTDSWECVSNWPNMQQSGHELRFADPTLRAKCKFDNCRRHTTRPHHGLLRTSVRKLVARRARND